MSSLKGTSRTSSVEAVSDCKLLRLTEKTYAKLLKNYPDFKAQIQDRIDQYDYKHVARVPLDFAEEILPSQPQPADAGAVVVEQPSEEKEIPHPFAKDGYFVKRGKKIRRFAHV